MKHTHRTTLGTFKNKKKYISTIIIKVLKVEIKQVQIRQKHFVCHQWLPVFLIIRLIQLDWAQTGRTACFFFFCSFHSPCSNVHVAHSCVSYKLLGKVLRNKKGNVLSTLEIRQVDCIIQTSFKDAKVHLIIITVESIIALCTSTSCVNHFN